MAKQIRCAMTGKEYESLNHAAKAHGVSQPTVLKSAHKGIPFMSKTLKTWTWIITPITPDLQPPVDNRTRSVLCVTTGKVYATMGDAAKDYGLHLSALSRAIKTGKPVRGYEFVKQS